MPQETRYTVLLIEADSSLRRLIALGLHRRDMQVIEVSDLDALAEHAITSPDLLILDIDNGYRNDASLLTIVQQHPYLSTLPAIVLTWEQALPIHRVETPEQPLLVYLAKPFDARALHATIENVLVTSHSIARAPQQAMLQTETSSPSICPLIAAAGLLLTVIGVMLQLLIAGAGLLIVVVALLWWTLGKRPQPQVLIGEVRVKGYASPLP